MPRRTAIAAIGTAAAWPAVGIASRAAMPVIGYLCAEAPRPFASRVRAFREGLAEMGYVEGRNVAVEFRWAEGRYDRLPALAADLAGRGVAVIVAPGGAPVALAAKSTTAKVPIVFEMGGDPVALGVVASLSRPGANLTGVSSLSVEASAKRLELLREVVRAADVFGAVVNPTSPTAGSQVGSLLAAAEALGLQLRLLHASAMEQFDALFAAVPKLGAGGLVFTSDPFFAFRSQVLAALAAHHGVPTITQSRDFTQAGGLMSYGGDFMQSHRQTGIYAGRILRGEKPSDLPVQQITRLELLVNLRAAEGLGLALPLSLLARADEVVE